MLPGILVNQILSIWARSVIKVGTLLQPGTHPVQKLQVVHNEDCRRLPMEDPSLVLAALSLGADQSWEKPQPATLEIRQFRHLGYRSP